MMASVMDISDFDWNRYIESHPDGDIPVPRVGRVISEHRRRLALATNAGFLELVVPKKFYYHARRDPSQLPAVGDWVLFDPIPSEEGRGTLSRVLPRRSKLSRLRETGRHVVEQVLCANVDLVFIVQSLDHNFNLNRLERYTVMAHEAGVRAVVILNKADLVPDVESFVSQVTARLSDVQVLAVSAQNGAGIERVRAVIAENGTAIFLGSSGVGKSTLLNALLGVEAAATREVRLKDSKGRHTTTRREMFVLPSGGVVIDTPGMRGLRPAASTGMVSATLPLLESMAKGCRFRDCDHASSEGCAILAAVAAGSIPRDQYESFIKLHREAAARHAQTDTAEARKKKRAEKAQAKALNRHIAKERKR
jgi:ribosome biogenesis GTPase